MDYIGRKHTQLLAFLLLFLQKWSHTLGTYWGAKNFPTSSFLFFKGLWKFLMQRYQKDVFLPSPKSSVGDNFLMLPTVSPRRCSSVYACSLMGPKEHFSKTAQPMCTQLWMLRPQENIYSCCSFAKLHLTRCDPMDCSTPGSSLFYCLLEFAQTHAHWIGDAFQPSHSLLPSSPALNLSQHQCLFQCAGSLHQVTKVLELQFQHQSFQWTFRVDFLYDWWVWSPCCPRDFQVSSPTPQVKSINSSALSLLYSPSLTSIHDYWKNDSFGYADICQESDVSTF